MTTTVTVEACCAEDEEIVFGLCYEGHPLIQTEILQNGQKAQKYIYGGLQAVVMERKKKK